MNCILFQWNYFIIESYFFQTISETAWVFCDVTWPTPTFQKYSAIKQHIDMLGRDCNKESSIRGNISNVKVQSIAVLTKEWSLIMKLPRSSLGGQKLYEKISMSKIILITCLGFLTSVKFMLDVTKTYTVRCISTRLYSQSKWSECDFDDSDCKNFTLTHACFHSSSHDGSIQTIPI